jgi:hypothetical protein
MASNILRDFDTCSSPLRSTNLIIQLIKRSNIFCLGYQRSPQSELQVRELFVDVDPQLHDIDECQRWPVYQRHKRRLTIAGEYKGVLRFGEMRPAGDVPPSCKVFVVRIDQIGYKEGRSRHLGLLLPSVWSGWASAGSRQKRRDNRLLTVCFPQYVTAWAISCSELFFSRLNKEQVACHCRIHL